MIFWFQDNSMHMLLKVIALQLDTSPVTAQVLEALANILCLEIFFNILKASVAVLPNSKQTWCTYTALYTLTFYKWSKTSDDTKHIHTFQNVSDHYDTR